MYSCSVAEVDVDVCKLHVGQHDQVLSTYTVKATFSYHFNKFVRTYVVATRVIMILI